MTRYKFRNVRKAVIAAVAAVGAVVLAFQPDLSTEVKGVATAVDTLLGVAGVFFFSNDPY